MNKDEQSGEDFISPDSSNIANSEKFNSKFSGIIDQAHSVNTLHLMSAFCQIFLGAAVILLSTAGLVKPIWISTTLSMFASVTTMLGMYFLYTVVFQDRDSNHLLRDAMRRVMDAKN